MKKYFIGVFLLIPVFAIADIDPVTLREESSPNKTVLSPEKQTSPRESSEAKLAAYSRRDEAWVASFRGVAIFPRRADWDFTGGAEVGFGYDWNPHSVELSIGIAQSHSSDYSMYETAVPVLLNYKYKFPISRDGRFAPYVGVSAGAVCNDYLLAGTHETKFDAAGALGCGFVWNFLDSMGLNVGYRYMYVHHDEYSNATGMGGGHIINLGLDFRF